MAFPNSLECKFSSVNQTPAKTVAVVLMYQVSDGGLDVDGHQLYIRVLAATKTFILDAGAPTPVIVAFCLARLKDLRTLLGVPILDSNLICNLTL